jgi:hypothetical protein
MNKNQYKNCRQKYSDSPGKKKRTEIKKEGKMEENQ